MFKLGMNFWGMVIYAVIYIGGYLIWAYKTHDDDE